MNKTELLSYADSVHMAITGEAILALVTLVTTPTRVLTWIRSKTWLTPTS